MTITVLIELFRVVECASEVSTLGHVLLESLGATYHIAWQDIFEFFDLSISLIGLSGVMVLCCLVIVSCSYIWVVLASGTHECAVYMFLNIRKILTSILNQTFSQQRTFLQKVLLRFLIP